MSKFCLIHNGYYFWISDKTKHMSHVNFNFRLLLQKNIEQADEKNVPTFDANKTIENKR